MKFYWHPHEDCGEIELFGDYRTARLALLEMLAIAPDGARCHYRPIKDGLLLVVHDRSGHAH